MQSTSSGSSPPQAVRYSTRSSRPGAPQWRSSSTTTTGPCVGDRLEQEPCRAEESGFGAVGASDASSGTSSVGNAVAADDVARRSDELREREEARGLAVGHAASGQHLAVVCRARTPVRGASSRCRVAREHDAHRSPALGCARQSRVEQASSGSRPTSGASNRRATPGASGSSESTRKATPVVSTGIASTAPPTSARTASPSTIAPGAASSFSRRLRRTAGPAWAGRRCSPRPLRPRRRCARACSSRSSSTRSSSPHAERAAHRPRGPTAGRRTRAPRRPASCCTEPPWRSTAARTAATRRRARAAPFPGPLSSPASGSTHRTTAGRRTSRGALSTRTGARGLERRIVAVDHPLELAQVVARLEAELSISASRASWNAWSASAFRRAR